MHLITWKEEYSVGIPEVDLEHRELIELINTLHQELRGQFESNAMLEFLGEIKTRISAHFALEEKIMRERGYDEYAAHKDHHETLLVDIRNLMEDYVNGFLFSEVELATRLNDWFGEHFRTHDARLYKLADGIDRWFRPKKGT